MFIYKYISFSPKQKIDVKNEYSLWNDGVVAPILTKTTLKHLNIIYAKFDADRVEQSKVAAILVQINQVKWPFKSI